MKITRTSLLLLNSAFLLGCGVVHAELKGTNATFYSWDDNPTVQTYQNSNSSIVLDGKWHPFFAALNFDNNAVAPAAVGQSGGAVSCSTSDTDGNGLTWQSPSINVGGRGPVTRWAGSLQLAVDHIDTGVTPAVNGFRETRCWELAVCDRQGTGTGSFEGADLSLTPRFRRFAIDVTASEGSCPTPTANVSQGYVNPTVTNGFITLLAKDTVEPCAQNGRCDSAIETDLYITLDRDCDGTLDYDARPGRTLAQSAGNLNLIGSGGYNTSTTPPTGLIPTPVGGNDPQLCFFSEGLKPDFLVSPQWTGNIQARISAPAGASGDKTVNHNILNAPARGDVGDLPRNPQTPSYPQATHVTNATATNQNPLGVNPFLGAIVDSESVSYSSLNALQDDTTGTTDDEDGITLPADAATDGDGDINRYTATAIATNPSARQGLLCGWLDFNQDGVLNNIPNTATQFVLNDPLAADAPAAETGERSCVLVPAGTSNGSFSVAWDIPESARQNTGTFYSRFRLSEDPDMFRPYLLFPSSPMASGEVEDYVREIGRLPVSISSFDSSYTDNGLELSWTTVSETHNLGFHVWGDKGNGFEQLSVRLIPAEVGDPVTPRAYSLLIPGVSKGEITDLAVTAIDSRGDEEVYGLFEAGAKYGQKVTPAPIPWQQIRQQGKLRGQLIAAERKRAAAILSQGGAAQRPDYVDIRVTEPGLQEVTWQMLADAGMNLNGVKAEDIAVTFKGEAVSRHVVDANPRRVGSALRAAGNASARGLRFDSGDKIRFWGEMPETPDKLYLDHYVYRIAVDPSKALDAKRQNARADGSETSYTAWVRQDEDRFYTFGNPLDDPWYISSLRADRNNVYTTTLTLDDALIADQSGRLKVRVGGFTSYDVAPDHHAVVEVNGSVVGESFFDGAAESRMDFEVPAGLLKVGENTIRILAPGTTAAPFDLFLLDSIELGYPRQLAADAGRIMIDASVPADGYRISGFESREAVAYAWDGSELTVLPASANELGDLLIPAIAAGSAQYWVSTAERVVQPGELTSGRDTNLLAGGSTDFVIVAHPSFMPVSARERHPLNEYVSQRRSEGWKPRIFDITEIQAEFGQGMALPEALTKFLAAADQRFDFEHVLLVGGDSYDYTNRLDLGSLSFIPTQYAPTDRIRHTPSDALLGDLDGDGLSDKAIGRWPVRTQGDLQSIVTKTLEWRSIDNPQSAIWVTDSEDRNSGSFRDQAERLIQPLSDAGWDDGLLDRVYFSEVTQRPGTSQADSARMDLFDQLEKGRALTGFVGHGSATMWTFQGLLTPDDIKDLYNEGNPTLIGTMTCYTSYFVSPANDTVAHRWMNGYRENAAGAQIEGVPNGAVAIHGASTLSDYGQNELFAGQVLESQLEGKTLGESMEIARSQAALNGMSDLVINWTLLGDPTLTIEQ